jgi:hypothetical protein
LAIALASIALIAGATPAISGEPSGSKVPDSKKAEECTFCQCNAQFARAIERATREVGALPNGIAVHYRSEDPEMVVEIQRYAFERQKRRLAAAADPKAARLCGQCRQRLDRLRGAKFDVANSVHGVFCLITSSDPEVVRFLHEMVSAETPSTVRGS